MDNDLLNDQVNTIRQAFGYIKEFNGALFVIKIDSLLLNHPLFPLLIRDIVRLHDAGIKIALIPGTRERINDILDSFGVHTENHNGLRISTDESIPFIKMAAFDVSNKVMTLLAEHAKNAVIGNWVRARSFGVHDGIDFLSTGKIDKVDVNSIKSIIHDNMIPIFPNIGWSKTGKPYNISSNDLAVQVSTALKAEKLFFVTGSSLSLSDTHTDSPIPQLTIQEATELLNTTPQEPEVFGPESYLHLIRRSRDAALAGVPRVHIIDGRVDGMLLKEIFSNQGFGTMIYSNDHENIRSCKHKDIADIIRITTPLVEKKILVKREITAIENDLSEYVVYEVDGTIHGCGALKKYENTMAEIYSIAVDDSYASNGTGGRIISYLIKKALKEDIQTLFLLTTQTTDWFQEHGFTLGEVENLPAEKQKKYNWERKSRILLLDLTNKSKVARFLGR